LSPRSAMRMFGPSPPVYEAGRSPKLVVTLFESYGSGLQPARGGSTHAGKHLADLTVTTDLDGDNGVVSYTADTVGAEGVEARAVLRDADGAEIASASKPNAS
jgi:hypothetical protein